jgi:hypothetical protein
MKPIAIYDVRVMNLGLGRNIYSPAQLEEFARFQASQETRRALLVESAERAYNSWLEDSGAQVFQIWPRRPSWMP